MKYTCILELPLELYSYLKGDERIQDRNTYTITKEDSKCVVTITANDAVALRSCFNTLGQSLMIWEKL